MRRRGLFARLACVRPMRRCGRPILRAKKSPHLARHLPRETSRLFGRNQCRWRLGCVRRSGRGPPSPGPGFARRTARPKLRRSSGCAQLWSLHERSRPSGRRLPGCAQLWSLHERSRRNGRRLPKRGGRSRWHRPAPQRPGGPKPLASAQPWSRREQSPVRTKRPKVRLPPRGRQWNARPAFAPRGPRAQLGRPCSRPLPSLQ